MFRSMQTRTKFAVPMMFTSSASFGFSLIFGGDVKAAAWKIVETSFRRGRRPHWRGPLCRTRRVPGKGPAELGASCDGRGDLRRR